VACIPLILNDPKVHISRGPAVDSTKSDEGFVWLQWGAIE